MLIPVFPHFTPLHLEDKASYEKLVAEFPPHSDISFATLHIWWNLEDNLSVSLLHDNVIINYHLSHDPENSGYCLVGKQAIDDSVQTIFAHLREQHRPVKLVHVPEFMVEELAHKERLEITEETDYNEYVLDSKATATLPGSDYANARKKINRFLRQNEGRQLAMKPLDVSSAAAIEQVLAHITVWEQKRPWKNDPGRTEYAAIKKSLEHAAILGIQIIGFYIDGGLCAISICHKSHDNQYYMMHHLKVDHNIPYIVEYVEQRMAQKALDEQVPYINMEMDLGIAGLREHKLGLKPVDFFRKYTLRPRG